MDDNKLRAALKTGLSAAEFPDARRRAVMQAVAGESPAARRKLPAALVFAVVLTLILGGTALAATLGIFGRLADEESPSSFARLGRLDRTAASVGTTQTVYMPEFDAEGSAVPDAILASMSGRRFDLTLDQAYCDGRRLYYSYTLKTDRPLAWIEGEGMPAGVSDWLIVNPGTYAGSYEGEDARRTRFEAFFSAHPVGYIAEERMAIGDGANLDGEQLMIWGSGEIWLDETTLAGYQEVTLPDGFTPDGDEIEIALTLSAGGLVSAQDGTNTYWMSVSPETGFIDVPFTVPIGGTRDTRTGCVATDAYTAEATLCISDIDISGEVVFDAPGWAEAWLAGEYLDSPALGELIDGYVLIAGGTQYRAVDWSFGVNSDGRYCVGLRFDLPESTDNLILRPMRRRSIAAGTGEDIVLTP